MLKYTTDFCQDGHEVYTLYMVHTLSWQCVRQLACMFQNDFCCDHTQHVPASGLFASLLLELM